MDNDVNKYGVRSSWMFPSRPVVSCSIPADHEITGKKEGKKPECVHESPGRANAFQPAHAGGVTSCNPGHSCFSGNRCRTQNRLLQCLHLNPNAINLLQYAHRFESFTMYHLLVPPVNRCRSMPRVTRVAAASREKSWKKGNGKGY